MSFSDSLLLEPFERANRGIPEVAGPRAELAIGWLPRASHCRAHVFVDGALVGGTAASGGRLFFELPNGKYAPGRALTVAARFLTPGWRCQIWLRVQPGDGSPATSHKLHEAVDPDPSNPNDDRVVWTGVMP